jgi:acetyl-CoA carboxylase beta subunit
MEWKLIRKDKTKEYYYCSNKSIYKCKATMKKLIESNLEQKTGHSNKCLRSRRINRTNSQKNISDNIENISFNKEQENVLLKDKLKLMYKLLKTGKYF